MRTGPESHRHNESRLLELQITDNFIYMFCSFVFDFIFVLIKYDDDDDDKVREHLKLREIGLQHCYHAQSLHT